MSKVVIRIKDLGKRYRIGQWQICGTLRDALVRAFIAPLRKIKSSIETKNKDQNYIWALKDIGFEVERGEAIGIIGRNGAGKTTLLKVLSRITPPTEGYAQVHGRVGSLLEVGTGFHSELTGRENIYFNGAILGMRKKDIERKFDQIVEFSEVEKFLDTPLKHYSTGMGMRLAFAIAAHLEPEIILVDEVLAVGDAAFQKKCLGKMDSVTKVGRTVLFVSHQMNQIRRICQRCIWLEAGRLRSFGPTEKVLNEYEASFGSMPIETRGPFDRSIAAQFLKWEISQPKQESKNTIYTFDPVEITFFIKVNKALSHALHGIALYDANGQLFWGTLARDLHLEEGIHRLVYKFSTFPLKPGTYYWYVTLFDSSGLVDKWYCSPEMIVATTPLAKCFDEWAGFLNLPYEFNTYKTS